MADILRFEPLRDMVTFRTAMDRLFDEAMGGSIGPHFSMASPAVDMYQTDNDVVVKATLPGVQADDISISVTGDVLTIRSEVKSDTEEDHAEYHLRERRYGSFSRSLALPVTVQSDKADARFENGVLTLTLPKADEVKPKTITVKAR